MCDIIRYDVQGGRTLWRARDRRSAPPRCSTGRSRPRPETAPHLRNRRRRLDSRCGGSKYCEETINNTFIKFTKYFITSKKCGIHKSQQAWPGKNCSRKGEAACADPSQNQFTLTLDFRIARNSWKTSPCSNLSKNAQKKFTLQDVDDYSDVLIDLHEVE